MNILAIGKESCLIVLQAKKTKSLCVLWTFKKPTFKFAFPA